MSKKLVALVLAFALVFSTFATAFAGEALPVDAQAAVTIGMLKGDTSAGVTNEYLSTAPDRMQAAIMFLRLQGLEDEALAFTGAGNFADANQEAWQGGRNVMAYLKANPELGWQGKGNNLFDPNKDMEVQDYYKVMLEALGYKQDVDFTYGEILEFAADHGLSKVAGATNFTVANFATATIEALKATVKGSTKTLATVLVEAGVIDANAAAAAGIYTPVPTVLAVESVKAINLKETVVTFNKEVDKASAEDASNYLLDDENIAGTVTLNDDKKSVTITWTSRLANQTEYDLTVEGILDAAGAELAEVTVTFLANDVTLPVAQSVKLVGPSKFEIQFSEPIAVKGDITVADADYDYELGEVTVDGNVVTVELSDEELEEGNYNVEVSNFVDFASLKSLKKTLVLAYDKDTTAPVATVKEVTQTKVVVEFNKPVYNGDPAEAQALTADFFYHTFTSYKPVYVETTDNKEFTLYFTVEAAEEATGLDLSGTDRALAEGNVKFVVVADGDDSITDEWGNEVKDNMTFTVKVTADTTAPTVAKVEVVNQTTVKVYFSEDVTVAEDNFTVVDKDGEEVDFSLAPYSANNDKNEYVATLTFSPALEGNYSITVEDVTDRALEENEIAKVTKSFTVTDKTAPSLTTADVTVIGVDGEEAADSDYIYVIFPEDMATSGAYSVLNKDNYQLSHGGRYYDLTADDKIATFEGSNKIKITLDNSDAEDFRFNLASEDTTLVIGRVADALGNKVESLNTPFQIKNEVMPVITKVKTLTAKTIEITVSGQLKAVSKSAIKVNNYENGTATNLYAISTWKVDGNNTVITAVLPADEYLRNASDKTITVSLDANELSTLFGTKVAADASTAGDVVDGFAPSVVRNGISVVSGDTNKFTITFDEALFATNDTLFAHDIVVKNSKGDILVAGVDYTTDLATADTVLVTIVDADAEAGDYKVYSNSTIKYIKDLEGNKANSFTSVVTLEDLVD